MKPYLAAISVLSSCGHLLVVLIRFLLLFLPLLSSQQECKVQNLVSAISWTVSTTKSFKTQDYCHLLIFIRHPDSFSHCSALIFCDTCKRLCTYFWQSLLSSYWPFRWGWLFSGLKNFVVGGRSFIDVNNPSAGLLTSDVTCLRK